MMMIKSKLTWRGNGRKWNDTRSVIDELCRWADLTIYLCRTIDHRGDETLQRNCYHCGRSHNIARASLRIRDEVVYDGTAIGKRSGRNDAIIRASIVTQISGDWSIPFQDGRRIQIVQIRWRRLVEQHGSQVGNGCAITHWDSIWTFFCENTLGLIVKLWKNHVTIAEAGCRIDQKIVWCWQHGRSIGVLETRSCWEAIHVWVEGWTLGHVERAGVPFDDDIRGSAENGERYGRILKLIMFWLDEWVSKWKRGLIWMSWSNKPQRKTSINHPTYIQRR